MATFRLSGKTSSSLSISIALILAATTLTLLFADPAARAQSSAPAPRKTSKPYTGDLTIFDLPGREDRLQINRVMDLLKIGDGSIVADIGAGSGWFTVRAAKRAGTGGLVYAVDINPKAIEYIQKRAEKEHLLNVKTILGKSDDAMLPPGKIQAALMLKTYHEVAEPVSLLTHLRESLAPHARVGIIDRNGNGEDHGIAEKVVVDEARQAGFKVIERYDFVKADNMDYFLILEAR